MDYVVLVEPEGPANIGAIARVMKNFGFKKLVLVNPKCEIGLETKKYAMHAWDLVDEAIILDDFNDIFSLDAELFVGTTAKPGGNSTRSSITPKDLASQMRKMRGDKPGMAFIFGREPSGLTNEELRRCDLVVHIPTSDDYKAMNLSHAVAVILYEMFTSVNNGGEMSAKTSGVNRKEVAKLIETFSELARLPELGLRNPENSVKMFRNIISRSIIMGREARGVIVVLERALEQLKKNDHKK